MVDIMSRPRCGLTLGTHMSIDGDELFLMASLQNQEAIAEIAEILEYRTMIVGAAYKEADVAIPTDMSAEIKLSNSRLLGSQNTTTTKTTTTKTICTLQQRGL
ncbi:unnamed protein product [Polarella glacialis]|uniref:Uncharacterized protein n=1 Tax=Polarella glacialis TaxID=89957 RepID=A0A813HWE3_POLGL|nr:unnamed protein product [Polarella glacialis]CAE8652508.1 unnamed protein product [Polarella glacialis]